jgi:hypothetical protein
MEKNWTNNKFMFWTMGISGGILLAIYYFNFIN